jgi:hypothetical protein
MNKKALKKIRVALAYAEKMSDREYGALSLFPCSLNEAEESGDYPSEMIAKVRRIIGESIDAQYELGDLIAPKELTPVLTRAQVFHLARNTIRLGENPLGFSL